MEKIAAYTPNKWLKYDIMDFFGIRDICEVQATIHRFSIDSIEECMYEIKQDMVRNPEGVYVIKLVYLKKMYHLPNYLLTDFSDWEKCKANLETREMHRYSEIWYCRNEFKEDMKFGRFLFCLDELFPRMGKLQTEIVWGVSARMIEEYPKLNTPFISLTKDGLTSEWKIQDVLYAGRNQDDFMKDVEEIIRKIPVYYRQIRNIGEWLRDCGCTWMSLEFSSNVHGKFQIIDWDTDNDLNAIKKWRELKMDRRG